MHAPHTMNKLAKLYLENRKPAFLPGAYYDGNEAKRLIVRSASTCLRWAREQIAADETRKAWNGETVDSLRELRRLGPETTVALVISPDYDGSFEDLEGDMFNPSVCPEIRPAYLEKERQDFRAMLEREGVWGIRAFYRDAGGDWQESDACWGFDGGCVRDESVEFMRSAMDARREAVAEMAEVEAFADEVSR